MRLLWPIYVTLKYKVKIIYIIKCYTLVPILIYVNDVVGYYIYSNSTHIHSLLAFEKTLKWYLLK